MAAHVAGEYAEFHIIHESAEVVLEQPSELSVIGNAQHPDRHANS
jgi:hypothetical protein